MFFNINTLSNTDIYFVTWIQMNYSKLIRNNVTREDSVMKQRYNIVFICMILIWVLSILSGCGRHRYTEEERNAFFEKVQERKHSSERSVRSERVIARLTACRQLGLDPPKC